MPNRYPTAPVALTGTPEEVRPDLDRRFLDVIHTGMCGCPGFRLFEVAGSDGVRYLVAADHAGGAETRVYLRSNGGVKAESIELLGDNDAAVAEWDNTRPWAARAKVNA